MKTESLKLYIDELNRQYKTEKAREHAYRPALKDLLESLLPKMVVTNEPAHFECGAPDYIIQREKDHLPVFFVEAKDVNDNDLDGRTKSGNKEQFDRYKQALDYIIFTDYLDFHLYEHGEFVDSVRIAETKGDKIVGIAESEDKFLAMIQHLGSSAIQRITSAPRLAKLMAGKARLLANIIETAVISDEDKVKSGNNDVDELFNIPQEKVFQTGLREQMETFQRVLLHDITPHSFADVYAQTIVYGLFAARLNDKTPEDFSRQEALGLIPKTSPFLRNLFQQIAGLDPDPRIEWVLDDLVTAFGVTDMQKILKGYHEDTQRTDPMMHFYEDFLAAYDQSLRKAKGVWYTPQPVVRFIVKAVDEILQTEFGLEMGLADYSKVPHTVSVEQSYDKRTSDHKKHITKDLFRVQILDPAMGTGTFISEIIRQVKLKFAGNEGIWNTYLCSCLLPRIYGFEVMVAPYTIAHMKTFLQLKEDSNLSDNDMPRMNLLLTNSLEEAGEATGSLFAYWLSQEAYRANVIKRDCPVMVMIGNPPYNGSSTNKGEWIMKLMEDYKKEPGGKLPLDERNPKWLNDDYVKFIRLAQDYIEKNGEGIIGFINPHGYLDNPTFRGMRWNLLKTFDKIYTIDLHGNSKKKETCPDGSKDENVFDIMQGVSINLFVKTGKKSKDELGKVYHKDLYGVRQDKYDFLDETHWQDVDYKEVLPKAPMYFFIPKDFDLEEKYNSGFKVDEFFKVCLLGPNSHRDDFAISFSYEEGVHRLSDFSNKTISDEKIIEKYHLKETGDWNLHDAREQANGKEVPVKCLYRAFDERYMLYYKYIFDRPRQNLNNHLLKNNLGLIVNRQSRLLFSPFVTNKPLGQHCILDPREGSYAIPLYLYSENMGKEERIVNFNKEIYEDIAKRLNYLPCYDDNILVDSTSEYNGVLYPQDLFDYIYAVLHSPSYRERYKEFLKIDFPRIPYPTDREKFRDLVEKGEELRQLHLMEDLPSRTGITFPVVGSSQVDCYRWQDNRVYINDEQYFDGVPEIAWNFYIGGYQPAQKWLKDRKGLTLSFEDVKHYQQIIYVLQQTERVMQEIDVITL
ncbi:MAG: DNA methyltransferase [Bacteroidaceae bacterium]|nr:DNA methyltransferase [Bacteroidaceae bacterium]